MEAKTCGKTRAHQKIAPDQDDNFNYVFTSVFLDGLR